MTKSSVTSNSSIIRQKGRAGSSGENTVEVSSEQTGSICKNFRSLITRHPLLRNIFPGCPFRELKISLICVALNPNGDKISNNKVSGAGSCSKALIRMSCPVCTFRLPSSMPFLYKRAASFCGAEKAFFYGGIDFLHKGQKVEAYLVARIFVSQVGAVRYVRLSDCLQVFGYFFPVEA